MLGLIILNLCLSNANNQSFFMFFFVLFIDAITHDNIYSRVFEYTPCLFQKSSVKVEHWL